MKFLILEGIATSGKSTVINSIKKQLPNLDLRVALEPETHIPIMKQTDELHITFFENLINLLVAEKHDLIIFDRLYLTQAFRAGVSLHEYYGLEKTLANAGAISVFLNIEEDAIAERIAKATEHRDPSWGEYTKTKGSSITEIANYYITQQRNQMKLLETSSLPYMVCNTRDHNYTEIAQQILEELQLE